MRTLLLLIALFPLALKAQIITTFAGNGTYSSSGDGGSATAAGITTPVGGVFDKHGNYYVAQCISGNRVRKIDITGIVTTITGNGLAGFSGDGGPASAAKVSQPEAVILDTVGNIYISDAGNNRIRKIDNATGTISTVVGTGTGAFGGDNGPATAAIIWNPFDISLDKFGNLYILDYFNRRIRKVDVSGVITTFAGTGVSGFAGDGGPATGASFNDPQGLAADDLGNIYIADRSNGRVRKVTPSGSISTVVGNGVYTYAGDGIPATNAQLAPTRLAFDTLGNLFISDSYNHRVYKVDPAGIFHLVAGNGITSGPLGDGGPATAAEITHASGIAVDKCGNLYIPQSDTNRIRKVTFDTTCNNSSSLATNKIKTLLNYKIYPNPATNEITIESPTIIDCIEIINLLGNSVYFTKTGKNKTTIDIHSLPPGLYFLKASDIDGNVVTRKIIKQ